MTRFLVDEDVNQKALRSIPARAKGFDVLTPEQGEFKGASDSELKGMAADRERVLVTCDRDFDMERTPLDHVPNGVLLIRPPRRSQKRVKAP